MDTRQGINMIGGGFQHTHSSSGHEPLYMKWVKGATTADISFHIDFKILTPPDPNKQNYALLAESRDINVGLYDWCKANTPFLEEHYKRVFTHDVSLLPLSKVFALFVDSKSFIPEEDGKVYPKSKLLSMIASNKRLCPAHEYRHKIIDKFKGQCDHFGRGFNPIENKLDGLRDYCFSIAMENGNYPNMVTEKIADCFMAGTIPIFYGIENIGDFFNADGIITLDENFKVEDLSFDLYYSKMDAVQDNFERAMSTLVAEDYIYLNYIKDEI